VERAGLVIDRPAAAILQTLAASDKTAGCRIQDLAHQLGIEAPSITRKTQELEQAGFVQRVPDQHDRRAVDVRVTAKGRAAAKKIWTAQRETMSQVLSKWDKHERREFVRQFERFSADLTRQMNPKN
jgi:DNA-binding MarR family transcriptional regulator